MAGGQSGIGGGTTGTGGTGGAGGTLGAAGGAAGRDSGGIGGAGRGGASGEAGAAGHGTTDAGCSCNAGLATEGHATVALLLLAVTLAPRRRRSGRPRP